MRRIGVTLYRVRRGAVREGRGLLPAPLLLARYACAGVMCALAACLADTGGMAASAAYHVVV